MTLVSLVAIIPSRKSRLVWMNRAGEDDGDGDVSNDERKHATKPVVVLNPLTKRQKLVYLILSKLLAV